MAAAKETITLKEHFEKILVEKDRYWTGILAEKDKALNAALSTAKEAVGVAENNAEKWRSNANEWRGAMSDREKNFITRKELWGWIIAVIGVVTTIVAVFFK